MCDKFDLSWSCLTAAADGSVAACSQCSPGISRVNHKWLILCSSLLQVLRGGTPIVESHSSRKPISVPQAFAGPAKRDFRRHKQRLGQNPSRPQPHFGFQSPFKPLDLTPARKRPFEVLVHGQGVLAAKEGHKTVEKKEPKSKGLKKKRAKAPQEAVEKAPPKGKKKGETASAAAKNDCKRAPVSLELADSVSRYRRRAFASVTQECCKKCSSTKWLVTSCFFLLIMICELPIYTGISEAEGLIATGGSFSLEEPCRAGDEVYSQGLVVPFKLLPADFMCQCSKFRRKLRKLSVLVFEELNARNQTLDLFALEKVIG